MWSKKIEPWIVLACQYAIYSWIIMISWNELFEKIEWMQVEWTQVLSLLVLIYFILVFVRTFWFMFAQKK